MPRAPTHAVDTDDPLFLELETVYAWLREKAPNDGANRRNLKSAPLYFKQAWASLFVNERQFLVRRVLAAYCLLQKQPADFQWKAVHYSSSKLAASDFAFDSGAATVRSEDVKWRFDVFAGLIDDFVNLYTHPVDPDLLQRLAAARMSAGPPPPGVSSRQAVAYENARWHLDRLEAQYKQHVAHAVVGYQQQLRGARQRYLVENKVRWRDLSPDRQVGLIERAQELLFETCKVHVDAQHEKRQQWPDPSSLINELFSALESEIRAAQGRYEECLANARSGVDSFSRVGAPAGAVANLDVLLVPLRNEDSARRFMLLTKRQQAQAVMGCTAAVVFVTLCVRERHELPSAHEVALRFFDAMQRPDLASAAAEASHAHQGATRLASLGHARSARRARRSAASSRRPVGSPFEPATRSRGW